MDETEGERPIEGTFLVTAADDATAVARSVPDGRVHPLSATPGTDEPLAEGEVVVGRLEPVGPAALTWCLAAVEKRFTVTIEESDEPPTAHERSLAPDEPGELVRRERAGEGELHVLAVPADPEGTREAVADVLADREGLTERAARLGVDRVVVRSEPGLVCVRYLP